MKITQKHISGYNKIRVAQSRDVFGGLTCNEAYNIKTFGIDSETQAYITKILNDRFGMRFNHPNPIKLSHVKEL